MSVAAPTFNVRWVEPQVTPRYNPKYASWREIFRFKFGRKIPNFLEVQTAALTSALVGSIKKDGADLKDQLKQEEKLESAYANLGEKVMHQQNEGTLRILRDEEVIIQNIELRNVNIKPKTLKQRMQEILGGIGESLYALRQNPFATPTYFETAD